ncbi:MAG: DUF5665 domain-containing protein [Candidatus Margulisiibacteriota bacterium]
MDENKPDSSFEKLARHLERANFGDYVDLLNRPWKLFWVNLLAGTARGLGVAAGMTAVFALVTFVLINFLKSFIQIPILGSYIAQLVEFVNMATKR